MENVENVKNRAVNTHKGELEGMKSGGLVMFSNNYSTNLNIIFPVWYVDDELYVVPGR